MNKKVEAAFNEQVNAELYSSYLYLSMAAYFQEKGLKGMAHWMLAQGKEENMHGMKFFNFIVDRGGKVVLVKIDAPQVDWDSPLDVFEHVCKHEKHVTDLINELVDLSIKEKDHASSNFLQWFVNEQVEEEASAQEVRDKLRLVKDNPVAIFMVDRELGERVMPAELPVE